MIVDRLLKIPGSLRTGEEHFSKMDLSLLKRAEGGEGSPKEEEDEPKTSQRPKFSSYTIASLLESVKRSSSPQEDKVVVGEEEEEEEERASEEESDLSVGEEDEEEAGSAHPRLAPSHPTPMHPLQVGATTSAALNQ